MGGLIQLVAIGSQDLYLTGNPQITFFKIVYKRYTNFSSEIIKQNFLTTPNFETNANVEIERNGDLITNLFFRTNLKLNENLIEVFNENDNDNIDYYIIGNNTLNINSNGTHDVFYDINKTIYLSLSEEQLSFSSNQTDLIQTKLIGYGILEIKLESNFEFNSIDISGLDLSDIDISGLDISDINNIDLSNISQYNFNLNNIFNVGDVIKIELNNYKIDNKYYQIHEDSDLENGIIIIKGNKYDFEELNNITFNNSNQINIQKYLSNNNNIDIIVNHSLIEIDLNDIESTNVNINNLIQININDNLFMNKKFKIINKKNNKLYLKTNDINNVKFKSNKNNIISFTVYLDTQLFNWVDDVGYSLINYVEFQIGGTKIDRHYGRFLHIWSQLTNNVNHSKAYKELINCEKGSKLTSLYIPLYFFFCRNNGLALPLIALQYHRVSLIFEFNSKNLCNTTSSDNISMSNSSLLVNYIFLDKDERNRFAQASHEYLIEQVQFTGHENVESSRNALKLNNIRLSFSHPIKELIWAVSQISSDNPDISKYKFINYTNNDKFEKGKNPVYSSTLQLNGQDRMYEENGKFFNFLQPLIYHSKTPNNGINVFSFSLKPEDHQPSGTCNFSRIDNVNLKITLDKDINNKNGKKCYIYAVNYNILRIMSGMGGIAFSN